MAKVKYFDGVMAAQEGGDTAALEPFDFGVMDAGTRGGRFASSLALKSLGPIYTFARAFKPVLSLSGFLHITRDAQVRQILERPDDFPVPFGPEMAELGGGSTFLLGLEGPEHARLHAILQQVIRRKDGADFAGMSAQFTAALLENSAGRIDVVSDLLKRVPAEICLRYFGLTCDDVDAFGDWTLAISALLFGDPYGKPATRRLAMNGAKRLRFLIDDALRRTQFLHRRGQLQPEDGNTLIERLVLLQQEQTITDAEIRAILIGMASGFIPTNTLAATRMLETLMRRPDAMEMARNAAISGDVAAMRRIIFEAGRLNPALAPGQWRYCPRDTAIDVDGSTYAIKGGTTLLVSTMSAMRDKRAVAQPKRFWPDRTGPDGAWQEPDLLFGIGPHTCIGKHLAIEQIAALFMVLLKQPDLKPAAGKAGKMQSTGPFPRHLEMTFTAASATQSMFIVMARANSGLSKADLDAEIAKLGNPAGDAIRGSLDKTNIVHFSSIATIEHEHGTDIAWELSADGTQDAAIAILARECGALLRPIFTLCGLGPDEDFAAFITRHVVKLHGKPGGANGLNYNGMAEFPVAAVEKQARFASFTERVLTEFLGTEAKRGSHAMLALSYVRRVLNQDRILALTATPSQRALMQEAKDEGYTAFQYKPAGTELKIADFKSPTMLESFAAFLRSRDGLVMTIPVLATLAVFGWLFWTRDPSAGYLWSVIGTALRAILAATLTLSTLIFAFFYAIRRAEKSDWIDTGQASIEHIAAIGNAEDAPGYAQNHILAVGDMKPGFLRSFAHSFALWAIRIIITYNYRPGFVINMGTIHYARWWRVPGTNKTAFYSNFNGSWESYLEDFITRARWGQTAVWSNWKGFPETKHLIFNGAEQGDHFKRWVRMRQQVVPFWYSRFPALTTDQIRGNALIHTGIARARTNSEAEEWLRCFGSMPRVANLIETDEVQAIVFSGMKRLTQSAAMILTLPHAPLLGEWMSWITGQTQALDIANAPENTAITQALKAAGVVTPVHARDGSVEGYSLAHSLTITFGDRPLVGDATAYDTDPDPVDMTEAAIDPQQLGKAHARQSARRAVYMGVSASGMAKFAPPNAATDSLLEGFPPAFRMGMAQRGRILGDMGGADASHWRWSDAHADAVLNVYAETPEDLDYVIEVHKALIENYGGSLIHQLDCAPANPGKPEFEHFGYRDGISQPVIRGTGRAARGVPERDMLEAGEFILGYKNGGGYFPPSPVLPAEADMARNLPILSDGDMGRFPDFGDASIGAAPRDFGRNGSFIVIRELAQDVDGFGAFVERKAQELRGDVPSADQMAYRDLYKLIGQYPDREWVKAKLMGRWPNGRPLIGNPVDVPSARHDDPNGAACHAAEIENDFAFGSDDPQGLACPFGSHIRRTNPRDSKQPGDVKEQHITNRHRLLRRGRTYTRSDENGGVEKGLLFVSVCADLERQFEFVQQVWSNASSFHGLTNEPDPIFSPDTPGTVLGEICPRGYTIPTPAGPIKLTGMQNFVSVKAGGYFFLPSRSALTWMTDATLNSSLNSVPVK